LRPVGSPKPVQVSVRVISATNRPLAALREEQLREDLYFRIATVVIEIPPLRNRVEDVLVLAQHFTSRLSRRYGRRISLAGSAWELLCGYAFPGNVRELENLLEGCAAMSQDDQQSITDRDLKPLLSQHAAVPSTLAEKSLSLDELERVAMQRALRVCQGNRTKAASLLGISRDTLYRKLKQFGLGS